MRRIGIMGGTFDPIHNGHLMLGRQAFEEYDLEKVWYMPSRQPPHKKDRRVTSGGDRVEMIRLAIDGIPFFSLSEFELNREGGNTYTADTLTLLREQYPDVEFYFIVGADSLYEIESWYRPETVMRLAVLLAADRDYEDGRFSLEQQIAYLREKYGARVFRLHCRELDVSSEEIRARAENGRSLVKLVPPPVECYITEHGLYRQSGEQGNKDRS